MSACNSGIADDHFANTRTMDDSIRLHDRQPPPTVRYADTIQPEPSIPHGSVFCILDTIRRAWIAAVVESVGQVRRGDACSVCALRTKSPISRYRNVRFATPCTPTCTDSIDRARTAACCRLPCRAIGGSSIYQRHASDGCFAASHLSVKWRSLPQTGQFSALGVAYRNSTHQTLNAEEFCLEPFLRVPYCLASTSRISTSTLNLVWCPTNTIIRRLSRRYGARQ
jgi:hypothetical protein